LSLCYACHFVSFIKSFGLTPKICAISNRIFRA
jgi:hypothetical protein